MIGPRTGVDMRDSSTTYYGRSITVKYPDVVIGRARIGAGQIDGITVQDICPCCAHVTATAYSDRRAE